MSIPLLPRPLQDSSKILPRCCSSSLPTLSLANLPEPSKPVLPTPIHTQNIHHVPDRPPRRPPRPSSIPTIAADRFSETLRVHPHLNLLEPRHPQSPSAAHTPLAIVQSSKLNSLPLNLLRRPHHCYVGRNNFSVSLSTSHGTPLICPATKCGLYHVRAMKRLPYSFPSFGFPLRHDATKLPRSNPCH